MKESLVEEREEKSIIESISKLNIRLKNDKKKPRKKIQFLKKTNRRLVLLQQNQLTSIMSLSIASSDSSLYQSDKAGFKIYIMKLSN